MKIEDIKLVETCGACPEQYDAFIGSGGGNGWNSPVHMPNTGYTGIDHTHCWEKENPPCGQKIKHFECCLCNKLHPEISYQLPPKKKK